MNLFDHIEKRAVVGGLVALAAIGFIAWYLLRDSSTAELSDTLTEVPAEAVGPVLGRDLLAALSRLQETTLDTGFFADPIFRNLHDFGVVIAPQPVGRRNPFASFSATTTPAQTGGAAPPGAARGKTSATPPAGSETEFDFSF